MYNTYRSKQFIVLAYKSRVGPFAVPEPLTTSETKSIQRSICPCGAKSTSPLLRMSGTTSMAPGGWRSGSAEPASQCTADEGRVGRTGSAARWIATSRSVENIFVSPINNEVAGHVVQTILHAYVVEQHETGFCDTFADRVPRLPATDHAPATLPVPPQSASVVPLVRGQQFSR
jgi:hypothetical protein